MITISKESQKKTKALIKSLDDIARQRLDTWIRFALSNEADAFADYVAKNWLSGSPVKVVTGETRHSVRAWAQKNSKGSHKNSIAVRPGVRGLDGRVPIPGTLNYLSKWTGTKLEFMRPAFKQFTASGRVKRAVEENVNRMLDKAIGGAEYDA